MKSLNLLVYLKFLIFDLEKRYIQKNVLPCGKLTHILTKLSGKKKYVRKNAIARSFHSFYFQEESRTSLIPFISYTAGRQWKAMECPEICMMQFGVGLLLLLLLFRSRFCCLDGSITRRS